MRPASRPLGYVTAASLAGMALLVRAILDPWLGIMQPFASGFVAVAACSWFFGWGPALLAAVISYVGGTYLFVEPRGHLDVAGGPFVAALLNFFAAAAMIIAIGERARRAERALAAANAALREADQRKDAFLATLSHELRNPVSVISNAVAMLGRVPLDDRSRATLSILSRQTALVARLIEDLLDVSRITRGRLALRLEKADVRTAIDHAVDANREAVAGRHQRITVDLPPVPVLMDADHARVVQVISNLIDNASNYSPEGAEVVVRLTTAAGVSIEVSDNGPGIDPDVLPHVFEMFEQGGASGSGGLGLGLGLCRHLVELHGGQIAAVPNASGRGTTFRIHLPTGGHPT